MTTSRPTIYADVTTKIIAALEQGTRPWKRTWVGGPADACGPLRAAGIPYRGVNVLILSLAAAAMGYRSPYWMTYRQARNEGGHVCKGEKATQVVKCIVIDRAASRARSEAMADKAGDRDARGPADINADANDEGAPEARADAPDPLRVLRPYAVFNADQIAGLPSKFRAAPADPQRAGRARAIDGPEAFFAATGARIVIGGTQPAYVPRLDVICMPPISAFFTARDFYAALGHEIIHWTGHPSRLGRLKGAAQRPDYAFEELIAEIGACFVAAHLGLEPAYDQSASYLASWLECLRSDDRAIFRAASAAQRAADHVLDLAGDRQTRPRWPEPASPPATPGGGGDQRGRPRADGRCLCDVDRGPEHTPIVLSTSQDTLAEIGEFVRSKGRNVPFIEDLFRPPEAQGRVEFVVGLADRLADQQEEFAAPGTELHATTFHERRIEPAVATNLSASLVKARDQGDGTVGVAFEKQAFGILKIRRQLHALEQSDSGADRCVDGNLNRSPIGGRGGQDPRLPAGRRIALPGGRLRIVERPQLRIRLGPLCQVIEVVEGEQRFARSSSGKTIGFVLQVFLEQIAVVGLPDHCRAPEALRDEGQIELRETSYVVVLAHDVVKVVR